MTRSVVFRLVDLKNTYTGIQYGILIYVAYLTRPRMWTTHPAVLRQT